MTKSLQKGFTLIELLVVIAIIGILAAVVLVAINPAERIAEANDSKTKSNVGQLATALESCYTANQGSYAAGICDSAANLSSKQFMKQNVSTLPDGNGKADVKVSGANAIAYGHVKASSNQPATACTGTNVAFIVYRSATGQTTTECAATTGPAV